MALRQTTLSLFRETPRAQKCTCKAAVPDYCLLDVVPDDAVARVFECLLELPASAVGIEYSSSASASHANVTRLALCCRRTARVLSTLSKEQQAEAVARTITAIVPAVPTAADAFTAQVRDERHSTAQLRFLKAAHSAMSCHCASACCARVQKAFNKDAARGRVHRSGGSPLEMRAAPVLENCGLLAAAQGEAAAFCYVRARMKKRAHGPVRARRFEDRLVRVARQPRGDGGPLAVSAPAFATTASVAIDTSEMSAPIYLCSSHDGSAAAYICALHEGASLAAAFAWVPGVGSVELERPAAFARCEELSAQSVWFAHCAGEAVVVRVAWSTDFVHSSGHLVGEMDGAAGPAFVFASYVLGGARVAELFEQSCVWDSGRLLSCSPTRCGRHVLALVRRREGFAPSRRCMYMYDVETDGAMMVPNAVSGCYFGPLCAAVSPSGDCVAALHLSKNSIVAALNVRTSAHSFAPVRRMDLTPWLSLSPNSELPEIGHDLVKAALAVSFSPCGRFVVFRDQHPAFGVSANNFGLVVVDTADRGGDRPLRPQPLFGTIDQAPRGLEWTAKGLWLLPPGTDANGAIGARGGALCLCSS